MFEGVNSLVTLGRCRVSPCGRCRRVSRRLSQTLRRWDAEGRLAAVRRPGRKYRFYRRSDLEPFRLEYRRAEEIEREPGLYSKPRTRTSRRTSCSASRNAPRNVPFASTSPDRRSAVVQIPVGCGKTGIIATLPVGISNGRVLVITPNLTIRTGDRRRARHREPRVLLDENPCALRFREGPTWPSWKGRRERGRLLASHFVVTNIQQLGQLRRPLAASLPARLLRHDRRRRGTTTPLRRAGGEYFRRFPDAKVVSLTATPFRSDREARRRGRSSTGTRSPSDDERLHEADHSR